MTDERRMRKTAQAVQAMLELNNVKLTVKEVTSRIEGKDLNDLAKLTQDITVEVKDSENDKASLSVNRRQAIGDFIIRHWNLLSDNDHVKTALLNGYCMGRYTKEKRDEMVKDLLSNVAAQDKETPEETQLPVNTGSKTFTF